MLMSKQLIFVYSKMKIKAKFKGLKNASALTLELRDGNGTIIGTADKIEKNRFKLKLDPSLLASAKKKKVSIQATLIDNNGQEANFTRKGINSDLSPDSQTFNFKLNIRKKSQKLKLKPITQQLEVEESSEPGWSLGDIQSLGAAGVSPHLEQTSTGYRLSYAADGGLNVADLSNTFTLTPGGAWTALLI